MTTRHRDDDNDEPSREEQIAELRADLAHSMAQRDRLLAPPTPGEIMKRAWRRLGESPWLWIAAALIVGAGVAPAVLFDGPPLLALPLALLGGIIAFLAALLRERAIGGGGDTNWRARQAREFEVEIGEIRSELFRLGVREGEDGRGN